MVCYILFVHCNRWNVTYDSNTATNRVQFPPKWSANDAATERCVSSSTVAPWLDSKGACADLLNYPLKFPVLPMSNANGRTFIRAVRKTQQQ